MLGYRALRFIWRTGAAPKAMDAMLLIATGVGVFGAFWLVIFPLQLGHDYWLIALLPIPMGFIGGLWYWSNHFRQRVPTSDGLERLFDELTKQGLDPKRTDRP